VTSATRQYTTGDLAARVSGELRGRSDLSIRGINSMEDASAQEITFIADLHHARRWPQVRARAALVTRGLDPSPLDPGSQALIVVPDAELAVIDVLELYAPPPALPAPGIHPNASVHPGATIGRDARVGPHASVDEGAVIGDRVVLHAGVRVYAGAVIGDDSVLHANAVVREHCRLGRRVILHPNASIGADGFNYRPAADRSGLRKVPQLGIVVIEDDVEIGANSCVDRAKFGRTIVGRGTKIDNLVQIGHNCRLGRNTVIAALTGLAGSVVVGDWVTMGGCVGIVDHARIGDGATIGAKSAVTKDVPAGQTWVGYPARQAMRTFREWAALSRLPRALREMSRILREDLG
jgi:UDP-3-O-[3-hydroxymyristoyl] glucosamine N-acyltransferase